MSRSRADQKEVDFPVPAPRFPREFPAGRRSNPQAAPDDQADPSTPTGERPRWARCADDEHWHLLAPTDAMLAATAGHEYALCGRRIPAEGLTLGGPSTLSFSPPPELAK
jgi:hypothetical protein